MDSGVRAPRETQRYSVRRRFSLVPDFLGWDSDL
jgi:hypothetical protein